MTGPPTPPPSSVTELRDEEKDKAPSSLSPRPDHVPEEQSAPQENIYQHVFPTIADLAAKGDFHELIHVGELTELEGDNESGQTRLLVIAPLVLAYLILDKLPPARYALTRLPPDLLTSPLSQVLLKLLSSSWERNHAKVYSRSEELFRMLRQLDIQEEKLVFILSTMLETFLDSFRHRTFVILSKAYVSIPLSLMQTYLGLPSDQLLPVVEKYRWSYDPSTQILTPNPVILSSVQVDTEIKAPSSLTTFHSVASSVLKLEM